MTAPHPRPSGVTGHVVGPVGAASILDVTERTIRRWADSGALATAYVTPGGHRRFYLRDVRRLARVRDGGQ